MGPNLPAWLRKHNPLLPDRGITLFSAKSLSRISSGVLATIVSCFTTVIAAWKERSTFSSRPLKNVKFGKRTCFLFTGWSLLSHH